MKLAILGTKPYYETDRILYEALLKGHEAVFLPKGHIIQTTFYNNNEFGIFFKPPEAHLQYQDKSVLKDIEPILVKPSSNLEAKIKHKKLGIPIGKKINNYYDLRYFDAVIVREMSKTLEWTTILADYMMSHKKLVIEEKIGKQMFYRSKHGTFYHSSVNGFSYPKTLAVTSKQALIDALEYINYPLIVKKSISSKGKGVYKCNSKQEVLDLIQLEDIKLSETLFQEEVQYSGDIRVFVVGDKILGAMRREPQAGEWKGNVAQGAKAYPIEIDDRIKKLALEIVALQNSEITGVDIMLPKSGPVIIETNRAPQFKGFETSLSVNVAKEIVEYIEKRFSKLSNNN